MIKNTIIAVLSAACITLIIVLCNTARQSNENLKLYVDKALKYEDLKTYVSELENGIEVLNGRGQE